MRIQHLRELDGYTQEFLDVVVADDPFARRVITLFAWGNPVIKIDCGIYDDDDVLWCWIGIDDGPSPKMITRQREVVANFAVQIGALVGDELQYAFETFNTALGSVDEHETFYALFEHLGEHDMDVFVDRIVHESRSISDENE